MAEYGFHTNRKARRAIDGPHSGDYYVPYEWVGEGDPPRRSNAAERNWQRLNDPRDTIVPVMLNHTDAWDWLRARELPEEHVLAPTVDEMIDAIAESAQTALADFMENVLHSEEGLRQIYHERDKINVRWWRGGFS
jgi:hypothetical protein